MHEKGAIAVFYFRCSWTMYDIAAEFGISEQAVQYQLSQMKKTATSETFRDRLNCEHNLPTAGTKRRQETCGTKA